MSESTPTSTPETKSPHVLIVGAGIAGLLMAILLERAGRSYEVFERASKIKPLGAIMSLNANILPVLDQLGMLQEVMDVSFTSPGMNIYNEDLKKLAFMTLEGYTEMTGYNGIVFSRPKLYDLFIARVPAHKIHLNKKLVSIEEGPNDISATFADETTFKGDILIGADGAYSGVRTSLYGQMSAKGQLPAVDEKDLNQGYITMVGTTESMDVEKYPILKKPFTDISLVIGKNKPYTWSAFTVPDHKFCWSVQLQLGTAESERELSKNSEWGPEGNEEMIKDIYDFQTPYGPLGEMIDATPKDLISKVFLEDKLFQTWYHGRTVLIGDACHKLLPSAGQGAVTAMQDAVILANCLYDLPDHPKPVDITKAFKEYKSLRFDLVKVQLDNSRLQASFMFGQRTLDKFVRYAIFNWLPKSVMMKEAIRGLTYRPQATFLPRVEKGSLKPQPQKPSWRYRAELEAAKKAAVIV